jgi:hypothetical protein
MATPPHPRVYAQGRGTPYHSTKGYRLYGVARTDAALWCVNKITRLDILVLGGVLFAIQDAEIGKKNSCAVWALDIDWWRDKCVVKKVPELGAMLKKGSNLKPEINFVLNSQGKPGVPCGIWPLNAYRLNERVVAQQALFVAPLDVTKTFMDNLQDCSQDQQNIFEHMIKFVIPCSKDIVPKAIKYLYGHNMTSATFSPGIDGFARSIANMVLLPDRFRGIGDDPYRDWPT